MTLKKFFIVCCLLSVSVVTYADGWIDFQVGYNNSNNGKTPKPRTPAPAPVVYLENHTLSFNAFEDDYAIQLLDENEVVVFSNMIPAGTTSFLLPTTLEGEYQIQLIYGNFIFTGYIEL